MSETTAPRAADLPETLGDMTLGQAQIMATTSLALRNQAVTRLLVQVRLALYVGIVLGIVTWFIFIQNGGTL